MDLIQKITVLICASLALFCVGYMLVMGRKLTRASRFNCLCLMVLAVIHPLKWRHPVLVVVGSVGVMIFWWFARSHKYLSRGKEQATSRKGSR